ncbi:MAG: trigger factor [Verrucomicrobiaceae bacterium]|nr:trigger factor [Verrucomicrobiaceae bacterium]
MNINVDHQPNCRVKVHVEVPATTVSKRRGEIINYFSNVARLPGYRPGKIPANIVTQRFRSEIDGELEHQLINEGCREAVVREKLDVIQVVSVSDRKFQQDKSFTFTAEIETAPKFELPDLKNIPVKLERVVVTDEDVDHEIFHLREHHQRFEDKEAPADMGDVVVLKYVVSMDGQPLSETHPDLPKYFHSVEDNWFMLDKEDDFIPGFYGELSGMKKGDQKEFTIALPGDFHLEALQNKNIEFNAECLGVKEKRLPDLNDEFFAKFGEGMTLETMKAEVRETLQRRREEARDASLSNQVLAHLSDKVQFDLPQEAVDRETQRRTNDLAIRAARSGMSNEDIEKNQEEIISSATQQARQNVKVSFILEEVAQKESVEVTQAQLQSALAMMASRSNLPTKKFLAEAKKNRLMERLSDDLRLQNALNFLKNHAAIEEVDPEPSKHGCAFEEGKA